MPDPERTVLVMCAGGVRSLFAAEGLQQLGYARRALGRRRLQPLEERGPAGRGAARALEPRERERYGRHLLMPEVGEAGQLRLLGAARCCSSAPAASARRRRCTWPRPASATLGIVDDDVVDRSNLQRQILHADARVGTPKVASARADPRGASTRRIERARPTRRALDAPNVERLFAGYDVVVDGSDNFADALPGQRRLREARASPTSTARSSASRARSRSSGRRYPRAPRAVLPLPLPRAAAAGARALAAPRPACSACCRA